MRRRIDNADTAADIQLRNYLCDRSPSNFVMVAGAGSGKTTSLVKALEYVGKKYGGILRARGQQVACITYTEVATAEILADVGHIPIFHVSTIHSFLWSLLSSFQKDIREWVMKRVEQRAVDLQVKIEGFGPRVQERTRDKASRDLDRAREQQQLLRTVPEFNYGTGSSYGEGILGHDDIIKMVPDLMGEKPLLRRIFAQKYPFCFVDESQDTFPGVVESLIGVAETRPGTFCLGFFGDPMQKIYGHGVGDIPAHGEFKRITKPENFRCSKKVRDLINRIRSDEDDIEQTAGGASFPESNADAGQGHAKLFIVSTEADRTSTLHRVRQHLAEQLSDELWLHDTSESDVRVLVIVHRMAASRLGFADLFSAFIDGTPESVSTGFHEGSSWALKPFISYLIPLVLAHEGDRKFDVMSLLRTHCPQLHPVALAGCQPSKTLSALQDSVNTLARLLSRDGEATVQDILQFVTSSGLGRLDERFGPALKDHQGESSEALEPDLEADNDNAHAANADASEWLTKFCKCPASQLWGYFRYFMKSSPFSTQQGIKGAEFDRVVVVLDDSESNHRQYSYDKLLGLKALSAQDKKNLSEGKDTVVNRTRRLFYVCCSRARKDLAVVLYTTDIESAAEKIAESELFNKEDIIRL